MIEGQVDGRKAGGEDGHGGQVDKLDELFHGGVIAAEVGGDDEGLLGLGQRVDNARDGCGQIRVSRCPLSGLGSSALDLLSGDGSRGDQISFVRTSGTSLGIKCSSVTSRYA